MPVVGNFVVETAVVVWVVVAVEVVVVVAVGSIGVVVPKGTEVDGRLGGTQLNVNCTGKSKKD